MDELAEQQNIGEIAPINPDPEPEYVPTPQKKKKKQRKQQKKEKKAFKSCYFDCKGSSYKPEWAKNNIEEQTKDEKTERYCQAFVLCIVSIIFMGFSYAKVHHIAQT